MSIGSVLASSVAGMIPSWVLAAAVLIVFRGLIRWASGKSKVSWIGVLMILAGALVVLYEIYAAFGPALGLPQITLYLPFVL